MVVTVEPGVNLSGRFGTRIQEMVAATEDGHHLLVRWSTQIHEMEVLAR